MPFMVLPQRCCGRWRLSQPVGAGAEPARAADGNLARPCPATLQRQNLLPSKLEGQSSLWKYVWRGSSLGTARSFVRLWRVCSSRPAPSCAPARARTSCLTLCLGWGDVPWLTGLC